MGKIQNQDPPPLQKTLGIGFLIGIVPLKAFLSKFHEVFLVGTAWRSMGDILYALATSHTFASENLLGAFLV